MIFWSVKTWKFIVRVIIFEGFARWVREQEIHQKTHKNIPKIHAELDNKSMLISCSKILCNKHGKSTKTETEREPQTITNQCKTDTKNWIQIKCTRGGPSFCAVGRAGVQEGGKGGGKPPPWGSEVRRIRILKSEAKKKGGRIDTLDWKGRRI
jgi:hypothetical protein